METVSDTFNTHDMPAASLRMNEMHMGLTMGLFGLMTLVAEQRGTPSPSNPPSSAGIDRCSPDGSFTVLGKRTRVAVDIPLSTFLTQAARAASKAGLREVTIKSECKLTTVALSMYCKAFEAENVHVISVMVPVGNPSARDTLRCGDTAF